jgi:hypothetical protein
MTALTQANLLQSAVAPCLADIKQTVQGKIELTDTGWFSDFLETFAEGGSYLLGGSLPPLRIFNSCSIPLTFHSPDLKVGAKLCFSMMPLCSTGVGGAGCEPFEIHQVEFDRQGRADKFSICKTQGLPYDFAVKVALIVFKGRFSETLKIVGDESDRSASRQIADATSP